jgi:serine protease Do
MTRQPVVRIAFSHAVNVSGILRAAILSVPLLAAHQAAALEADKLFEKVSPSIFIVVASDAAGKTLSQGSGVVVAPGKLVTNCHVLARAARILIKHGNASYGAKLEFPDPKRDLCQLDVQDLAAPAIKLGSSAHLRIGQRVYAVGAPIGLELTLSDGLVSSLRASADADAPQIQTSAPISPGSSGGGLFDSEGNLIGITTWGYRSSRDIQNLNFAIPADWIRELPERGRANLAQVKERAAAATAAGLPAADPDLPKEMPQVGDTWTYVALDLRFKPRDRSRKFVHTVRKVDASTVVEQVTQDGKPIGEYSFTNMVIGVYRAGTVEVSPFANAFQLLKPGASWGSIPIRGLEIIPETRGAPIWRIDRARVVGDEKVVVVAGTFDATKLVLEGRYHTAAVAGTTAPGLGGYQLYKETIWYAPSVKRIAKLLIEGYGFTDAYELESFAIR